MASKSSGSSGGVGSTYSSGGRTMQVISQTRPTSSGGTTTTTSSGASTTRSSSGGIVSQTSSSGQTTLSADEKARSNFAATYAEQIAAKQAAAGNVAEAQKVQQYAQTVRSVGLTQAHSIEEQQAAAKAPITPGAYTDLRTGQSMVAAQEKIAANAPTNQAVTLGTSLKQQEQQAVLDQQRYGAFADLQSRQQQETYPYKNEGVSNAYAKERYSYLPAVKKEKKVDPFDTYDPFGFKKLTADVSAQSTNLNKNIPDVLQSPQTTTKITTGKEFTQNIVLPLIKAPAALVSIAGGGLIEGASMLTGIGGTVIRRSTEQGKNILRRDIKGVILGKSESQEVINKNPELFKQAKAIYEQGAQEKISGATLGQVGGYDINPVSFLRQTPGAHVIETGFGLGTSTAGKEAVVKFAQEKGLSLGEAYQLANTVSKVKVSEDMAGAGLLAVTNIATDVKAIQSIAAGVKTPTAVTTGSRLTKVALPVAGYSVIEGGIGIGASERVSGTKYTPGERMFGLGLSGVVGGALSYATTGKVFPKAIETSARIIDPYENFDVFSTKASKVFIQQPKEVVYRYSYSPVSGTKKYFVSETMDTQSLVRKGVPPGTRPVGIGVPDLSVSSSGNSFTPSPQPSPFPITPSPEPTPVTPSPSPAPTPQPLPIEPSPQPLPIQPSPQPMPTPQPLPVAPSPQPLPIQPSPTPTPTPEPQPQVNPLVGGIPAFFGGFGSPTIGPSGFRGGVREGKKTAYSASFAAIGLGITSTSGLGKKVYTGGEWIRPILVSGPKSVKYDRFAGKIDLSRQRSAVREQTRPTVGLKNFQFSTPQSTKVRLPSAYGVNLPKGLVKKDNKKKFKPTNYGGVGNFNFGKKGAAAAAL